MFLFCNLFLISPIGLPGVGSVITGKKLTKVLSTFLQHIDIFLYYVIFIILFLLLLKLYKLIYKIKLRHIEILFYRLYSEILLLDKIKKSAKIHFSEQESIDLILKKISSRFFIRKVGKHNQERIVDGLNFIRDGELDTKSSLLLVSNWFKMLSWLISNQ